MQLAIAIIAILALILASVALFVNPQTEPRPLKWAVLLLAILAALPTLGRLLG
jgi:hypothetical protein